MPRPTPTPDRTHALRNWLFGYKAKLRPHRRALATSASLAALLCATTLLPGSAEANCYANVTGTTYTISDSNCLGFNFGAVPSNSNAVVSETGNITISTLAAFYNTRTNGDVGDITIQGTARHTSGGYVISMFGGNIASLGNIYLGPNSVVSGSNGNGTFDIRFIPRMGTITTEGDE